MMRYDNIIWDFDGTLFNTYPAMCRDLQAVMEGFGVHASLEDLLPRFTTSRETVLAWCGEQAGMTAQEVDQIYRAALLRLLPKLPVFMKAKPIT